MNIKKKTAKFMSLLLSFVMAFSGMIPAYAMETAESMTMIDGENISTEERNLEDVTVTYKQASSFFVTIPKTIVLDGWKQSTYTIKVSGDIGAEQCVYVAPVDSISKTDDIDFYMKDQASENAKEDVVATVTHNKFHWSSTEAANGYEQKDNLVSAEELTAGAWKGIFQMEIRLETYEAHKHNYAETITKEPTCTETGTKTYTCECGDSYTEEIPAKEHHYVDGECECGVIDPNHKHNYEDGMCTICGEEESYSVAPAEAYSNWNYTLDDENGVIILNYYKGSETDVIVYGNYVIGDKIYETQFKSNINGYYESITYPYMFNADSHPNMATEDQKFTNNKNIRSIKFSKEIDTGNVTNMNAMFYKCESLTSIEGLDHFDTSNVTNMKWMFGGCKSLTSLDLSNFDTSQVTDMKQMFSGCYALTNLDVSNFDTRNVTGMSFMFGDCRSLINLNVNNFDTSNVTDISGMFSGCYALTSLDVSNFNTSNVTNMSYMFQYSKTLASLDLSNFDTSNVSTMRNIFYDCTNLETIYVSENKWKTSQANTSSMFSGCGTSTVTFK